MNASPNSTTRRDFLRSGSAAAAVAFAAPAILVRERAFAQNVDTLKIGLVGCGGRGTGAAGNALTADPNLILWAVGDAFPEPLSGSVKGLKEQFGGRVQAEADRQFVGLDAFQKVIDSGVDVVKEIADLIEAQRGYELNSKVITASDEMMAATTRMR